MKYSNMRVVSGGVLERREHNQPLTKKGQWCLCTKLIQATGQKQVPVRRPTLENEHIRREFTSPPLELKGGEGILTQFTFEFQGSGFFSRFFLMAYHQLPVSHMYPSWRK